MSIDTFVNSAFVKVTNKVLTGIAKIFIYGIIPVGCVLMFFLKIQPLIKVLPVWAISIGAGFLGLIAILLVISGWCWLEDKYEGATSFIKNISKLGLFIAFFWFGPIILDEWEYPKWLIFVIFFGWLLERKLSRIESKIDRIMLNQEVPENIREHFINDIEDDD